MDLCAIPTSRYILTCTKVVHYLFPESQLVTKVTLYIHNSTYILDKMSVIFYINFQWLESTLKLSHHSSYRSPKIFNFKVKLVLFLIIGLFLANRPLLFASIVWGESKDCFLLLSFFIRRFVKIKDILFLQVQKVSICSQ